VNEISFFLSIQLEWKLRAQIIHINQG